jgi:anti-sigma factor RsiW
MTDMGVEVQDRRLWRRWRALGPDSRSAEPDAMLLASYAEGRLSEADAEAIEAWLAARPEALGDIIAARSSDQPQLVDLRMIAQASALVDGAAAPAAAKILPFRRRSPQLLPPWRTALTWSSIAASLLCASLVGFSMGSDAYANLSGTQVAETTVEGLGAPSLDYSYFSDDSGT